MVLDFLPFSFAFSLPHSIQFSHIEKGKHLLDDGFHPTLLYKSTLLQAYRYLRENY